MNKNRFIYRETIKYIVTFGMLLNHISHVFMDPDTIMGRLFIGIGYSTAIAMCYFLEEGYRYTRSRRSYVIRLGVFALLSQLPYSFAFAREGELLSWNGFNMIFTLLLCFLFLLVLDYEPVGWRRSICIIVIVLLAANSDWNAFALIFVYAFHWAEDDPHKKKKVFFLCIAFVLLNYAIYNIDEGFTLLLAHPFRRAALFTCLESTGMLLSAFLILYAYNGKKLTKFSTFHKWFFYLFYPLHLLVLGGIRLIFAVG